MTEFAQDRTSANRDNAPNGLRIPYTPFFDDPRLPDVQLPNRLAYVAPTRSLFARGYLAPVVLIQPPNDQNKEIQPPIPAGPDSEIRRRVGFVQEQLLEFLPLLFEKDDPLFAKKAEEFRLERERGEWG